MREGDVNQYRRELSDINKAFRSTWQQFRTLRNKFHEKYPRHEYLNDPQWQDINDTINDLFESPIKQEIRRNSGVYPVRDRTQGGILHTPVKTESVLPARKDNDEFIREFMGDAITPPPSLDDRTGLYKSDLLCIVCGLPLKGRQEFYCGDKCRDSASNARNHARNPETLERARMKYNQGTSGKPLVECIACGGKLTGNQRKYCSPKCKKKANNQNAYRARKQK